jgi:hypothetical protein
MKDKGEFYFGILILLIITGFLVLSLGYSPTARMVPMIIAIVGIVFIGLQLLGSLPGFSEKLSLLSQKKDFFGTAAIGGRKMTSGEEHGGDDAAKVDAVPVKEMFLWVVLFAGAIFLFGFLLAVPVLVCIYLKYRARTGWPVSIFSALGILFVMYFGFIVLLEVLLYKGYLFVLIMGR